MAHGDTKDSDGAAARLKELAAFYREHPVTGPEGHSYISCEPRATAVTPGLPFNANRAEYITASVREIAEHTLAANPQAGPLPASAVEVYDWMREHLEHAPETEQFRAEVIEYRQWLEHCLETGDHETVRKQVRKQACPKCGCWGLMWMAVRRRAVCTNSECTDQDGFSTALSLSRLAHAHVTTRKNLRRASAT
ncbi:hypothetical protein [Streptomyces olivaceoviridis]|uniref:hypothetical protein n=1 Tax=Streptomyces olivaceoviridis TaxID=1921 RepID=UPI0036755F19